MGPEIKSCDWLTQKKGPMPDLDSFPLVPKGPIVSQTLIQLNTRVGLQTMKNRNQEAQALIPGIQNNLD